MVTLGFSPPAFEISVLLVLFTVLGSGVGVLPAALLCASNLALSSAAISIGVFDGVSFALGCSTP